MPAGRMVTPVVHLGHTKSIGSSIRPDAETVGAVPAQLSSAPGRGEQARPDHVPTAPAQPPPAARTARPRNQTKEPAMPTSAGAPGPSGRPDRAAAHSLPGCLQARPPAAHLIIPRRTNLAAVPGHPADEPSGQGHTAGGHGHRQHRTSRAPPLRPTTRRGNSPTADARPDRRRPAAGAVAVVLLFIAHQENRRSRI